MLVTDQYRDAKTWGRVLRDAAIPELRLWCLRLIFMLSVNDLSAIVCGVKEMLPKGGLFA
jgi:hypothetical protein